MSLKRPLWIAAIAAGSLAVCTQAMALNPQPLPPGIYRPPVMAHSRQVEMRKAGGDPKMQRTQRTQR